MSFFHLNLRDVSERLMSMPDAGTRGFADTKLLAFYFVCEVDVQQELKGQDD
jgi:hypothetical protein